MKFKVINFGCKVNTYESTYIEEKLLSYGYSEASSYDDANFIVVNTCSVTNVADQKCRKLLRRIKRENPTAVIVATGCSVQNNIDEYKEMGIDILVDNYDKTKIPDLIKEHIASKDQIVLYDQNRNKSFDQMKLEKFKKHTRAFIKVQDGCDNFCSYCIIPFLRGTIRSKDFNEVIEEAKDLSSNGHKEIVLVGIHTGSYSSNNHDLVDLINEISKIDEVKRIRISSIEITELNDKFMDMLKNNNKVVNHLHIPLQAGSDEILKIMNRKYDLDYFYNKINLIRSIRPDINITTDVIVGHPHETEALFNKTIDTCKKIAFGKIHVFPYSERKNTKASLMDEKVSEPDKKKRANLLIRLSDVLEREYEEKFIGNVMNIITEVNHQDEIVGFTENYIKVKVINSDGLKANEIINVKLIKKENDYILSEYVKK